MCAVKDGIPLSSGKELADAFSPLLIIDYWLSSRAGTKPFSRFVALSVSWYAGIPARPFCRAGDPVYAAKWQTVERPNEIREDTLSWYLFWTVLGSVVLLFIFELNAILPCFLNRSQVNLRPLRW